MNFSYPLAAWHNFEHVHLRIFFRFGRIDNIDTTMTSRACAQISSIHITLARALLGYIDLLGKRTCNGHMVHTAVNVDNYNC